MSVYFIQAGGADGPIKIGVAKHPERRLAALQIGCPLRLALLFSFPAGEQSFALEGALHYLFRDLAIDGTEWHEMSPRLTAVIASLRSFWLRLLQAHGDGIQIGVKRLPGEIVLDDIRESQSPLHLSTEFAA